MTKISSFQQLLILLYKGLLLRKRHYIVTFFEIVIPVLIASVFPMIYSEQSSEREVMINDLKDKYTHWVSYKSYLSEPSDSFTDETVKKLKYNMPKFQYPILINHKDFHSLRWQTELDNTFITENKIDYSGKKFDNKDVMQKFNPSKKAYSPDSSDFIRITPFPFAYGYLIFVLNLIARIIEEKSNGSKELLKMMGMTNTVYWTSTFANYFMIGSVSSLITSIVYKAPLKNSVVFIGATNFFLLYLMLLLYMSCLVLYCMVFTIFFNKALYAIITYLIVEGTTSSLLFVYCFETDYRYLSLPLMVKLALCLLPMSNLYTIFRLMSVFEYIGEGIQWWNLTNLPNSDDLNVLRVSSMAILACLLYITIIWYFDKVWPWQPGVPQPFYFLFTKSYWRIPRPKDSNEIELADLNNISEDYFEEEPSEISLGVAIRNLSKKFRKGFQTNLAVNNISLNLYHGQITALLGHNGAGKTTTINILTGLYPPSCGTASINGFDILTDTINARKGLGVCPQHNVLFDTLTVDEHLKIFAGLKGVKFGKLSDESVKVLEIMKLTDKRFELVKNLSGGMKRKLSLGNAIVGGSKVLFLDEPTSGLDVEARRSVWDALLNIRRDRTIVLTTHYMEEADILGDRIAIMAEGEIQCCGSPMFLKRKFGTGYHLHLVKIPGFKLVETETLLKRHMSGIILENELENELSFKLTSNCGTVLGNMFEELEEFKQKLGIGSCGITITTMEDVFLRVSNLVYTKREERQLQNGVSMEYEDVYGNTTELKQRNLINQLLALLEKRFHYAKRDWSIWLTLLILPIVLTCLSFYIIRKSRPPYTLFSESLKLSSTSHYAPPGSTESIFGAILIPLALGSTTLTPVLYPIHERTTKSKLLQVMTGLPRALYWFGMFAWDFLLYFIVTLLLIIPFAAFQKFAFFSTHSNAMGSTLLFMSLFGYSSIAFSYLISLIFKKGISGFIFSLFFNCLIGISFSFCFLIVPPLEGTVKAIFDIIYWICHLLPSCAVTTGLRKLFVIAYSNIYCEEMSKEDLDLECKFVSEYYPIFLCCKDKCGSACLNQTAIITWEENACGRYIFSLTLSGTLFFILLITLGSSYCESFQRLFKAQILKWKKAVTKTFETDSTNDSDVIAEEQRVHNLYATHGSSGTEALVTLELTKIYRDFFAVDHLSFGIHKEECFGLLGVNGAGKTTTFRMLTGDCPPTAGNAFANNCSLILDRNKFQSFLGYCPQFDALIDRLTGREMLTLFARLRGLSGSELKDRVNKLIKMTDLSEHADKQTRFYSGGNKRKLSVGIALIGCPPLILLDEPTAGVDPVSRRKIWNILAQARNLTKAAIILTTHSMEESEALCSRLAIMINGKFKCLGSIQQLKSKFGQGYTLIIKVKKETSNNLLSMQAIKTHINDGLSGSALIDDHQDMLQYHIRDTTVKWSKLFKFMEEIKSRFDLEDYLISDTSLEQIFLSFARTQRNTE